MTQKDDSANDRLTIEELDFLLNNPNDVSNEIYGFTKQLADTMRENERLRNLVKEFTDCMPNSDSEVSFFNLYDAASKKAEALSNKDSDHG